MISCNIYFFQFYIISIFLIIKDFPFFNIIYNNATEILPLVMYLIYIKN